MPVRHMDLADVFGADNVARRTESKLAGLEPLAKRWARCGSRRTSRCAARVRQLDAGSIRECLTSTLARTGLVAHRSLRRSFFPRDRRPGSAASC
jgi:hypothetical protein